MWRSIQNHRTTKRIFETAETRFHKTLAWFDRFFVVRLVARTVVEMSNDDATHMAAGVAYYALFSIFPLMLGVVAILSFVGLESIQSNLGDFLGSYLPGSERFVLANLGGVPGALGLIAIVGLFWSGSAIFGAISRAVNRAWDVHKDLPLYIGKPRQLAMALGVGFLFLLSIGTTTAIEVLQEIGVTQIPLVDSFGFGVRGISYIFTVSIFVIIYKFLPNTKTYWKYIWPGALLAAILFEISKSLFVAYLENFATYDTLYGSLSPVIVFLFWTYIVALILILGAELSSEYGRMMMGVSRGQLLHPVESSRNRLRRAGSRNRNGFVANILRSVNSSRRPGYVGRRHHAALIENSAERVVKKDS